MSFRTWIGPVVLVLFLAIAGYIVAAKKHPAGRQLQGFTLTITQTTYPNDHEPILTATKVRQQKADGSWKLQTTYANGRVDNLYGQPGTGVFWVDSKNQQLDQLSDMNSNNMKDVDWRKERGYVGDETILGYTTHHIRNESAVQTTDIYMSPQLPGYPLRSISTRGNVKTIWEVTEIQLGEPSFDPPPAYPVDRSRHNASRVEPE